MLRMEAVCVSGFLLLLFSTGVKLSPDPQLKFGHEGGNVSFHTWFFFIDDYVLYRVCEDGELLLLINCSQPERPHPHGYEVECFEYIFSSSFEMSKLTMSHSGDYRAVGWSGGNITDHTNYRLTVCAERCETPHHYVSFGASVELCSLDSILADRSTLQLYSGTLGIDDNILVLDTNSSLEPLVEDLRGRLQVDLNNSLVTLSGLQVHDSLFHCTVWSGGQCQSYTYRVLLMQTIVFAHEEENMTLPCIAKEKQPHQVYWDTPTGRGRLIINQTHPQEVMYNQTHPQEAMYMLNGSQTGDYSLIIPAVSLQISGEYYCRGSDLLNYTLLYVCTELSPLKVMFSSGQNVLLNITEHLIDFGSVPSIQWYRQRVLRRQMLFVDSESGEPPVSLPEDLRGRVTVSTSPSNSSLIISNITAEDSWLYIWRVYGEFKDELGNDIYSCSEGSFRLVYLDPFGVHSPFYRAYASLMGCGILGMVTAVIWFKLRSRRGEQTSGRQSREGQQKGDEDLYEELEMAELNTFPSAVSDGAVEHSV